MVNLNVVEGRLNNKKESPCPAGFFIFFIKNIHHVVTKKLSKISQPTAPLVCEIDILGAELVKSMGSRFSTAVQDCTWSMYCRTGFVLPSQVR